ncbi:MAG: GDP-mannose 4,6-dehydratase [candidate division WOR-3 bacterium]|nr:GDP-mannose 4,6-dehydratase [candidate division WOR-3 bacterium]MCR4423933.1 GDP-mannose 4,6-dehydratase [candidate division WOR-3 bacterium]MDH7519271.1 GDP-mannose 4,6-dehydratase [bacterium]
MNCLITGITGFAGSHLAEYLLSLGNCEVHGTIRWRSRTENIDHLKGKIHLHDCDLRDSGSVYRLIADLKPDRIYHLAAQSYVPMSWTAPQETFVTNVIGQLNIFEAVRATGCSCRIQIAGSSEEYGLVMPDETPIKETNPLRPLSPYAVSKVAQDLMGYQYHQSYKMHIIRTRGFNHTGPRRGMVFVTSNFARQIAEIEKGKREPVLYVGNLEAVRDFTDVRDTVRAYYLILEKGVPGEVYNVATGKGYKIRQVLEILQGLSTAKFQIKQDPKRLRPSDVELLIGDPTKLKSATGWEPQYSFEQTLKDLLDYWRERV